MQCPSCGKENRTGASFCGRCQYVFTPAQAAPGSTNRTPKPGGAGWGAADSTRVSPASSATAQRQYVPAATPAQAQGNISHKRPVALRRGYILGNVRGFQSRTENQSSLSTPQAPRIWTIWTFRVECLDTQGNRIALVPVEMRGLSFQGSIADGDSVEIRGSASSRGTLHPGEVRNRTTGAVVRSSGKSLIAGLIQMVLVIIFLIVFCSIASFVLRGFSEFGQRQTDFNQQICADWGDRPNPPPWCK
jgi:hypothetical protein